ncbi:DUF4097 family beta strand repeat-containing protein [Rhodohalobacter sp. 8-1]|uniref:DUF4097 family beta strand repeat-containing protein n=1 Tax=Rhodohalobacter sp. 8-1 TaxID=3131972 RepID=UPI0030EF42F4
MAVHKSLTVLLLFAGLVGFYNPSTAQDKTPKSRLIEQGLVKGEPFESERFPVDRTVELSVFTLNGNVEIYENPDIDYIQIDLYVDRGFSLWSGSTSLDNYRIIFQRTREKIIASVEPRRTESRVWKGDNITFSYIVQTPVNVSSRIRNTKGDIYARNLKGKHLIQATVGNLFLDNLEGEINAFSASGNITAENMKGELNAKTTNGGITVVNSDGEVRLRTVTGPIDANSGRGTFIAATTTGNINARLFSVGEGSYIETVTGSVNLTLPAELNYSIQASGSSVDVSDLLNQREFEGRVQQRVANVKFGSGTIPIQISSVSGNVIIKTGTNR